jgi:hypothetical protein
MNFCFGYKIFIYMYKIKEIIIKMIINRINRNLIIIIQDNVYHHN